MDDINDILYLHVEPDEYRTLGLEPPAEEAKTAEFVTETAVGEGGRDNNDDGVDDDNDDGVDDDDDDDDHIRIFINVPSSSSSASSTSSPLASPATLLASAASAASTQYLDLVPGDTELEQLDRMMEATARPYMAPSGPVDFSQFVALPDGEPPFVTFKYVHQDSGVQEWLRPYIDWRYFDHPFLERKVEWLRQINDRIDCNRLRAVCSSSRALIVDFAYYKCRTPGNKTSAEVRCYVACSVTVLDNSDRQQLRVVDYASICARTHHLNRAYGDFFDTLDAYEPRWSVSQVDGSLLEPEPVPVFIYTTCADPLKPFLAARRLFPWGDALARLAPRIFNLHAFDSELRMKMNTDVRRYCIDGDRHNEKLPCVGCNTNKILLNLGCHVGKYVV